MVMAGRPPKRIPFDRMKNPNRLLELREHAGLRQEDMARLLGITTSGYRQMEHGDNDISGKHIQKLVNEFGCSVDWLLCASYINYAYVSLDRHELDTD